MASRNCSQGSRFPRWKCAIALTSSFQGARRISLADAQFVLARDHGFDSWPTLAKHIETLTIARDVDALTDPASRLLRRGHSAARGTFVGDARTCRSDP
jgi:hypothetical protein